MRILFLTHRMPYPPNKGDKIRSFHILEHLVPRHEVHLASLVDDTSDLAFVPEIERRVRTFSFERIGRLTRPVSMLEALLRSQAITVAHFYSQSLQEKVDALIDAVDFDCVFAYSSPMAEYLYRSRHVAGRLARAVRIMDLIDVDSHKWLQYAERSSPWTAWIYRREARHLAAYETRIAREFDHLFVVSEEERAFFPGEVVPAHLRPLSNGVDLEFFAPSVGASRVSRAPSIVFTGVMDYWPNVEGVSWFVEHVWPRVLAAIPQAKFYVVGRRPSRAVRRLAAVKGVVVTGFVVDTREYLREASVCIAPLRIARGVQNKVLEAMAMGLPVVSTPQAFEGVRAKAGADLIVAEGEAAFASAVTELLENRARAETIGRNGRRYVEKFHGWRENLAPLSATGI